MGTQEDSDNSTPKSLTNPDGDTNVEPPIGEDNSPPIGEDNSSPIGEDNSSPIGEDNPPPIGEDNPPPIGEDNPPPIGEDNPPPIGEDNPPPIGEDNSSPIGEDNSSPIGEDNSSPIGEDNSSPIGEDNSSPIGEDNSSPIGEDNSEPSQDNNNIKDKINSEFEKITKIISKTKNKVIVKDDSDSEKEIIIVSDTTCPTQSETIQVNGIIDPKGIRLLANFYPCIIQNGGITMNIPESPHLNLALIYIDNNIDNHAGTLISPSKIQSLDKNQGLFSIELDKKMKGNDPITGELTTLEKINGLALYNNGNEPIEFKEGNSIALTATFTK